MTMRPGRAKRELAREHAPPLPPNPLELQAEVVRLRQRLAAEEHQRQGYELRPKILVFTVGPALTNFGTALGADANGVMGTVQWMPSAYLAKARDFAHRYKEKFGYNRAGSRCARLWGRSSAGGGGAACGVSR